MTEYKLYWLDNLAKELKYIGKFPTEAEAYDDLHRWWKQNNFTPNYVRSWKNSEGKTMIDYGSHYHFYQIHPVKTTEGPLKKETIENRKKTTDTEEILTLLLAIWEKRGKNERFFQFISNIEREFISANKNRNLKRKLYQRTTPDKSRDYTFCEIMIPDLFYVQDFLVIQFLEEKLKELKEETKLSE